MSARQNIEVPKNKLILGSYLHFLGILAVFISTVAICFNIFVLLTMS